ncbi:hypothetical protein [Aestuariimicrobium kwangyangense]|uniref:hypothetical protein n=1 Tax=Aestuariimicrobium kwangyangense TaxID=396389 RepID=UPI0003B73211|nr:hypothetical protein [Aestuariimicrobium kwangyangense]
MIGGLESIETSDPYRQRRERREQARRTKGGRGRSGRGHGGRHGDTGAQRDVEPLPMARIALRVALVVAVASLGASVALWLRIAFSGGEDGALRIGTLSGLVAATFGIVFGCLIGPTLITVLAARSQMARSRRTAWVVVGVLVTALLALTLLALLVVLGSGLFAQGLSLAWLGLVVVAVVMVPGAPWFVRPLVSRR